MHLKAMTLIDDRPSTIDDQRVNAYKAVTIRWCKSGNSS